MEVTPIEQLVAELADINRTRFFGKYRAIVTNVDDPEDMARIRVNAPEIYGDLESPWALPCAPYSGNGEGNYMIPSVSSGTFIECEAGDPARPLYSGCWWAKGQLPQDENGKATKPSLKIIRSSKGLLVKFDDDSQEISLSDKDGKNILTIKVGAGKITVKGARKAVVEAPQIELVENASHPVVFGDELMQYLNQIVQLYQTHTHPGELAIGILPVTPAPPLPPFPPPTPQLISTRVKAG